MATRTRIKAQDAFASQAPGMFFSFHFLISTYNLQVVYTITTTTLPPCSLPRPPQLTPQQTTKEWNMHKTGQNDSSCPLGAFLFISTMTMTTMTPSIGGLLFFMTTYNYGGLEMHMRLEPLVLIVVIPLTFVVSSS